MTTRLPRLATAMARIDAFLSPASAQTVLYLFRHGLECEMHSAPWCRYRRAWRPAIREAIRGRHTPATPPVSEPRGLGAGGGAGP